MFVFLIVLLVPPCAGHPSDKATFLPQDKAALLAQRTRAPFPVEKLPHRVAALCLRGPSVLSRVLLFPLAEQEWSACCHGSDTAMGQRGPGEASDRTQDNVKPSRSGKGKRSGKQRKGKVSMSVWETRLSPALERQHLEQHVFVVPRWRGSVSAPTTQPHGAMP